MGSAHPWIRDVELPAPSAGPSLLGDAPLGRPRKLIRCPGCQSYAVVNGYRRGQGQRGEAGTCPLVILRSPVPAQSQVTSRLQAVVAKDPEAPSRLRGKERHD